MLFRPIRTIVIVTIAFVAGMVYERSNANERCTTAGGQMINGLCEK